MAKLHKLVITSCVMFLLLTPCFAMPKQEQCLKCHQDVRNADMEQSFIHEPFAQNQCNSCHGFNQADNIIAMPIEQKTSDVASKDDEWMEWLAESFVENTNQAALLPLDICASELTIKLWYQNRSKQQSILHCPDTNTIPTKATPSKKPDILQLHLSSYYDKLLSRATLAWGTDTPCRCQLFYTFDGHEYVLHQDDCFTNNHNQEIRNFKPGDTNISIKCTDTSQQHTQSQFMPLTSLPLRADNPNSTPQIEMAEFSADFNRIGDNIEISITTNQPATMALGQIEQNKEPLVTVSQEPMPQEDSEHSPLANKEQLNTTICFKCHRSTVEVSSHPINVSAPPGMIIPPEYPLLDNGELTCMTCHSRHSSNNPARLVKSSKKALCTGCHTNY